MPLGNGRLGANVWVEADGSLHFYLSHTDAWSQHGRLLKLGHVRISTWPAIDHKPGAVFLQSLDVKFGCITVTIGHPCSERCMRYAVWIDAHSDTLHVQADSKSPCTFVVSHEQLRKTDRVIEGRDLAQSIYGYNHKLGPAIEPADILAISPPIPADAIAWYHRNETSMFADNLKHQGLGDLVDAHRDPLLHRTFGCIASGPGLVRTSATQIWSSGMRNSHHCAIRALVAQTNTAAEFVEKLVAQPLAPYKSSRQAHNEWWDAFWNRSYITVTAADPSDAQAVQETAAITRGYGLQRFIAACAGRGEFPIKFNGSIFTADWVFPDKPEMNSLNADFRHWGGPYWFQNTRLAYWPMLACGDFDMMQPFFRMYLAQLPLLLARTQTYFAHCGAFMLETCHSWGTYADENYGLDRAGKHPSHCDNRYIRWHWSSGLELAAMILDYFSHTGDERLLRDATPLIREVVQFYSLHYPRDASGKLLIEPAQALETWWDVSNPTPEIAGLIHVLDALLNLPESDAIFSQKDRSAWRAFRAELPTIPVGMVNGVKAVLPARAIRDEKRNCESPELYALFPFPLAVLGTPMLEEGRNAYLHRTVKNNQGWGQDPVDAARVGLAHEAASQVAARFLTSFPGARFPAFWGPNYDWIPDQDHGGVGMIALQNMLLLNLPDRAILLPAWPKKWNAQFRLRAARGAVIEGEIRNGELSWQISPKDALRVEVHAPQ